MQQIHLKRHRVRLLAIALLGLPTAHLLAEETRPIGEPAEHVFKAPDGFELKAYVFSSPLPKGREQRSGIVLFHGGGWDMGEPAWAFARARHFAEQGMVAVAVQYRLSDQKSVTPVVAMSDARAAIRWFRSEARAFAVDPKRIAAYGWSAGGHLATSAAIFDDAPPDAQISAAPNALVLVSPAVSVAASSWFQRLLGERFKARDFSPDEHVREGLPPTLILQGSSDTVTPLPGARRFCERMRTANNVCELHVYDGFGHLFTPAGIADDGMPQPDPATASDALARADRFLRSFGFMDEAGESAPVVTRLYSQLRPLFQRHYPRATSQQQADGMEFSQDVRTFLIHTALKTGEWQEAREEKGPNRRGILCTIQLCAGRYEGAAVLPQTFNQRYFETLVMAVSSPDQRSYLYVHLSYPDTVAPGFLKDFSETVERAWASEG